MLVTAGIGSWNRGALLRATVKQLTNVERDDRSDFGNVR